MKIAVITGATSGIGKSILKLFLDNEYTVWAAYRDIKHKKFLASLSENVIPFRIDLSKKWTIREAIKNINEGTDKIDVLVNVAGKVVAGPLEVLSVDKIREQFEVNTFGQLEFAQGLYEKLDGGKIINISSMASYGLFPFIAPYCASKKALDMLFSSLMIETGARIKIISVKPGVISTPLWSKAIEENEENIGSEKYRDIGNFLKSNAKQNISKGLNSEIVAKKVLEIANLKNPKKSYTVGLDAFAARIVSKLPQNIIDIIIEKNLAKQIDNYIKKSSVNDINGDEDIEEYDDYSHDEDRDPIDTIFNKEKTIGLTKNVEVSEKLKPDSNIEEEKEEKAEKSDKNIESALEKAIKYNKS